MRIDESRVFVFQFDTTDMGGVTFPMRANTREEAATQLQACLSRIQTELAMEFPKISPGAVVIPEMMEDVIAPGTAQGLSLILSERIDKLMADLGATSLTPPAKAETIKNWTELDYSLENYANIVKELELIASGQKTVPAPKPKKK